MNREAPTKSMALAALGIRVIDDFIDGALLSEVRDVCTHAEFGAASLYKGGEVRVDESHRRAKEIRVPSGVRATVRGLFRDAIGQVSDWYAETIDDCASPSFLRYLEGDFFIAHVDRTRQGSEPDKIRRRAVSAVLFLNGHDANGFEGGELLCSPFDDPAWNACGFELEPLAGRLVLFPSTMIHEVKAVRSGERLTVVTWFQTAPESEECGSTP